MRVIFVPLLFVLAQAVLPAQTPDDALSRHLPGAIEATDDLRRHMEMMLQGSATFRQQCLRLDAPRVRVQIRLDPTLLDKPYRAITVIHRSADEIVASVVISGFGDPTEWLAHELEHVIEQIDGVNLPRLADGRHDAWPSSEGAFETTRAIRAGKTVFQEVRGGHRALARAIKPVESGRGDY
jgi:hypothetical protein